MRAFVYMLAWSITDLDVHLLRWGWYHHASHYISIEMTAICHSFCRLLKTKDWNKRDAKSTAIRESKWERSSGKRKFEGEDKFVNIDLNWKSTRERRLVLELEWRKVLHCNDTARKICTILLAVKDSALSEEAAYPIMRQLPAGLFDMSGLRVCTLHANFTDTPISGFLYKEVWFNCYCYCLLGSRQPIWLKHQPRYPLANPWWRELTLSVDCQQWTATTVLLWFLVSN